MEAGDALPAFFTVAVDALGVVSPGLEGEPLIMGQNGQRGSAEGSIENPSDRGEQGCYVRDKLGRPAQHPAQTIPHPQRQLLLLAVTERVNRQQGGYGAGPQDLREDHE